ncbi:uncharacterized protein EHS24_004636 [Apiotrichum porosum]|uniref:Iron-dependent peroxidase n=1 Tax=Apiotrichum porosum TaxID=105984 RepID=A0A427Y5N3_9TREE|nr:uncharacterized protein EHS24_004636 [Apiotrichum porosum]RSH86386.1 hypothetical protein EHS24_004636 [Apiotrichum porosum]
MPTPQAVAAPLTACATFLTLTLAHPPTPTLLSTVRNTLSSLPDIVKNVAIRDATSSVYCTVGIGAQAWSSLTRAPQPAELARGFQPIKGAKHSAPSTPGDLFLHLRGPRRDLTFELERLILAAFGESVRVADATAGFRYFDARDLLGFVDGTANPVGSAVGPCVTVNGDEDGAGAGGSYLVVQKYLHDLSGWNRLKAEDQESIVGRTKWDNVELDDAAPSAQKSHKTLATIDKDGKEYDILRDNMPFGSPGEDQYGTYFISYTARLWVVEKMLQRMFIGVPEGKHDRILDFSTPVTGGVYFVPPVETLVAMGDDD